MKEILLDFGLLNYWLLLCSVLGLPFVLGIKQIHWRLLISPVAGYGAAGVAGTVLYAAGMMPAAIHGTMALFAGGILVFGACRLRFDTAVLKVVAWKWVAFAFLVEILLILPKWVGGVQFYLFQGNHWDNFNYITASFTYIRYPYEALHSASQADILRDPLVCLAQTNLTGRPTVMLLFSILGGILPQYFLQIHYVYLIFLLGMVICALSFCLYNVACMVRCDVRAQNVKIYALLVGVAFAAGFWGQYILDINAWSQLSSVALNLLLMYFIAGYHVPEKTGLTPYFVLITLLAGSSWYFYPESFMYHLAIILPMLLLAAVFKRWHFRTNQLVAALCGIVLGILTGLLYMEAFKAIFEQLKFGTQSNTDWWKYFQRFLTGRDSWGELLNIFANAHLPFDVGVREYFLQYGFFAGILQVINDILLGLMGFYYLTPKVIWTPWVKIAARILTFSAIVIFFIGMWKFFLRSSYRCLIEPWAAIGLISLTGVGALLAKGQIWGSGKAYSYIVIYLFLLAMLPLMLRNTQKVLRIFCITLIALNLGFGLERIGVSTHADGIHRAFPPYPGIQLPAMKQQYNWNIKPVLEKLQNRKMVAVRIDDPWFEHYVKLMLTSLQVPYYSLRPINNYYGTGTDLGYQKFHDDMATDLVTTLVEDHKNKLVTVDLRQQEHEAESAYALRKASFLHPVQLSWGHGAYEQEGGSGGNWRWTQDQVELTLDNSEKTSQQALLKFTITVSTPGSKLQLSSPSFGVKTVPLDKQEGSVEVPLELPQGKTTIHIATDSAAIKAPGDSRRLYMKFKDVIIVNPTLKK